MSDKIERGEFDFLSDRFGALEALTSTIEEVVVPVPEVPVYDNFGQFISFFTRTRAGGLNVPNHVGLCFSIIIWPWLPGPSSW